MVVVGTAVTERSIRPVATSSGVRKQRPPITANYGCNKVQGWAPAGASQSHEYRYCASASASQPNPKTCSNESGHAANNKGKMGIPDCFGESVVGIVGQNRHPVKFQMVTKLVEPVTLRLA
jgi:hypothetical protein